MTIKKGDKFNKLTAINFHHKSKWREAYWLFRCDCGNEKVVCVNNVKRNISKSCGCLYGKHLITHNMSKTKVLESWHSMKNRCLNKNNPRYKYYGGRGITICKEWLKFENFYNDMGDRPENKTLDRIKNNLGYCKSNCKWSTIEEQNNNRSNNHFLTHKGKTQTIAQWARELDINYGILFKRINRNWTISRAFKK